MRSKALVDRVAELWTLGQKYAFVCSPLICYASYHVFPKVANLPMNLLSSLVLIAAAFLLIVPAIQAIFNGRIDYTFHYLFRTRSLLRAKAPIRFWIMVSWFLSLGASIIIFAVYRLHGNIK